MTYPLCNQPETCAQKYRPCEAAVPESRRMLDTFLKAKGLDHLRDDGRTVLSELLTNASAPRGALSYPRRSREELEEGFWV